jgi:predicted transposase YbfD/YdcC
MKQPESLVEHFRDMDDPRVERTRRHGLLDIVVITICAVIAGAESWDDVELFGNAKAEWLATFLEIPNGIPSHDTFNRVFAALDPKVFRERFTAWMHEVVDHLPAQVIAIDGKTVRGSRDRFHDQPAIHIVSAWAATNRLVLGQVKVGAKTNEITAIPEVLQLLALTGCLVTIDAMGCQRAIAQQIVDQEGDYVLTLKDHQPSLAADVRDAFLAAATYEDASVLTTAWPDTEKSHGRITTRTATPNCHRVASTAASLARIGRHRTDRKRAESGRGGHDGNAILPAQSRTLSPRVRRVGSQPLGDGKSAPLGVRYDVS